MYHSLSQAMSAGLPLSQTLALMGEDTGDQKGLRQAFTRVLTDVERGASLHEAMRRFPGQFSSWECDIIRVGEESGTLDTTHKLLSEFYDIKQKRVDETRKALFYPLFLLLFANFVVGIPAIVTEGFGPYIYAAILRLAVVVGALLILRLVYKSLYVRPETATIIDSIKLRIPVWGKLHRNQNISLFVRALLLCYRAGLDLNKCITLAADACSNQVLRSKFRKAADGIDSGQTLSDVLIKTNLFPPFFKQVFVTGETTGRFEEVVTKCADYLEQETQTSYKNVITVMGFLAFLLVAASIGYMVAGAYLRFWDFAF